MECDILGHTPETFDDHRASLSVHGLCFLTVQPRLDSPAPGDTAGIGMTQQSIALFQMRNARMAASNPSPCAYHLGSEAVLFSRMANLMRCRSRENH
jgi:hypothetical protein